MVHFFHGLIGSPLHFKQVRLRLAALGCDLNAPMLDYLGGDLTIAVSAVGSEDVVVGNSIGCALALECTAKAYILTAPPFDFSQGAVPLQRALIEPWVNDLYKGQGQIADEPALKAEACAQLNTLLGSRTNLRHIRRLKREAQDFLSHPKLKVLAGRLHFVIGAQDYTTPPDVFLDWVAQAAPGATVTVIEGCGHAVPIEQPGRVAEIIAATAPEKTQAGGRYAHGCTARAFHS